VICHTDNHASLRQRVDDLGVRTVIDAEDHGYRIMQLHPGDTGGSFLEIDFQPGGEDLNGPWMPAGDHWQRARRTEVVDGMTAVVVQCRSAEKTAARWGDITGIDAADGVLRLDNATVTFVEGVIDSLVGVTLSATDPARTHQRRTICGVAFTVD
jgi:hypothetical protein